MGGGVDECIFLPLQFPVSIYNVVQMFLFLSYHLAKDYRHHFYLGKRKIFFMSHALNPASKLYKVGPFSSPEPPFLLVTWSAKPTGSRLRSPPYTGEILNTQLFFLR